GLLTLVERLPGVADVALRWVGAERLNGCVVVVGNDTLDLHAEALREVLGQRVECFCEVFTLHRRHERDGDRVGLFGGAAATGEAEAETENSDGARREEGLAHGGHPYLQSYRVGAVEVSEACAHATI